MCEGSSKLFFEKGTGRPLLGFSFGAVSSFFGSRTGHFHWFFYCLFLLPAWVGVRRCFSRRLFVQRILDGHLCWKFFWSGRGGLLSTFGKFPFPYHLCLPVLLVPLFRRWYSLRFLWWTFHHFLLRAVAGYVFRLFVKPAVRSPALNDDDHHLPTFINYGVRDFLKPLPLQADDEGVVSSLPRQDVLGDIFPSLVSPRAFE